MSEIIASGIVQKSTLQQWIDVFTPLVDEGKLHFNDDGLSVRCVDPANVASILPGKLHAHGWEHYDSPGSVTQGADFNRLEDLIDPAANSDLIELKMDMEKRALLIQFDNVNTSMGLIDPDSIRKEPDSPDLDLPNRVVVEGSGVKRAMTMGNMVSDHIGIRGNPADEEIEFYADGDIDTTTVTFGPEERIGSDRLKDVYSLFSLDYLKDMAKPIPDNAEVTIHFGEEFPIIIKWEAADGAVEVKQMLAPRIQTD